VLIFILLLKILTFTWHPFDNGFDACYRSLYIPIENPIGCEKSYEGPFLRRSDLGLSNTSRIDRTVDFGIDTYDWNLPFINEYPRLSALWLTRLPFAATYGAIVANNTSSKQYLPIFSNGELEASLAGSRVDQSDIPLSDLYQFPRLQFLQVPTTPSELLVKYRYTDDDAETPPDTAPPSRGPYAQLKIGKPLSRNAILKFVDVRIRGWTLDLASNTAPDAIVAVDSLNQEISRTELEPRPDVAVFWSRPSLQMSGFNFVIPASALTSGNATIRAKYGAREITIGVVAGGESVVPLSPPTRVLEVNGTKTQIETWLDADRNKFSPLAPMARNHPGHLFKLLTLLIDGFSAAFAAGLTVLIFLRLRWWVLISAVSGLITFAFFDFASSNAPNLLGSRLFLPIAIFAILFTILRKRWKSAPAVVFLPSSLAIASVLIFDILEKFFPYASPRWWGQLLFYWRDSDWYATRGYARQVFVSGSLHGGESLFWFQAGPRYLSFVVQSLLGENDVLIGLLATTLGYFALSFVVAAFIREHDELPALVVSAMVLVVGLLFLAEGTIAGFGFVGSSEHPTWVVLFAITGYFVSRPHESRTWLLVILSLALGYCVQLRPNQIGGLIAVFLALLLHVDRSNRSLAIGNISKMVTSFGAIVSLSLLHNLYYGESFIPFTANGGINVAFEWAKVLSRGEFSTVWLQLRTMLYWNASSNWGWALMFWGSQLLWVVVLVLRTHRGQLLRAQSLFLAIPFSYGLPMLKYQMSSYYPRHLVAINLAFMCTALISWPQRVTADKNEANEPIAQSIG
jgi:hypothetical protein